MDEGLMEVFKLQLGRERDEELEMVKEPREIERGFFFLWRLQKNLKGREVTWNGFIARE